MTRASLLQVLNHVGGISETEVRELEQLASAFPYCQTAHLLLAKAAHDQGSMLASQRLRRAATYAADRELLRQLLEQPTPEPATIEVLTAKELPAPTETDLPLSSSGTGSSTAFFQALVIEDVQPLNSPDEDTIAVAEELQPEPAAILLESVNLPELATTEPLVPQSPTESDQAGIDLAPSEQATVESPAKVELQESISSIKENSDLPLTDPENPEDLIGATATVPAEAENTEFPSNSSVIEADLDELSPATAPPIRPPAEAGTSRFEFGLDTQPVVPAPVFYQLPELPEDETESDVEANSELLPFTTALAPAFRADTELAYGLMAGGSRMGWALQLRDEELTEALPAADFFSPDALLHAHASSKPLQPSPAPPPSSTDLINRFLKVQPRLKSPGGLPPVREQTDLAARNAHSLPSLASESLAKILVKQGKTNRAIEIYEQLMVRQPEKSAYFADQIQHLKNPE